MAEPFAASLAAELRFPLESNRANFMVAVFCAWARQRGAWKAADPGTLEERLGAVDVPVRLRRAEFVLQGVNALFDGASPGAATQLAAMKSACWDLLTRLRGLQQQVAVATHDQAAALFGPQALNQDGYLAHPETFAARQAPALGQLYDACAQEAGRPASRAPARRCGKPWPRRRATGTRLPAPRCSPATSAFRLGFAHFPGDFAGQAAQLTPITAQRSSPLDATCLKAVDSEGVLKADPSAKLDGVSISHFGAFFEKSWRENDYLWGRLDGAELAFRLFSRQSGGKQDLTEYLRSALTAILAAEKQDLTLVAKISRALGAQVAAIKPGAVPGPG